MYVNTVLFSNNIIEWHIMNSITAITTVQKKKFTVARGKSFYIT